MKRTRHVEVDLDEIENKRRIKVSEENGELRIVIKTENEAPRTRRRLEEMARDNLECEPATSNLVLADLQCEKCFSSISMKNKLELESLLFQNEDTDFKKEINDRLVNIENLLIRLTNSRKEGVDKPSFNSITVRPTTNKNASRAIPKPSSPEFIYEEHLDDDNYDPIEEEPIPDVDNKSLLSIPKDQKKKILAINRFFPMKTLEAMEQVNTRLLNDEQFAEDVISFFRFLNYRISPKTGETCKTLQKIIADDVASKFNWNGVSGKLAMKEHILFSKIIYVTWGKYLNYEDYEVIVRKTLKLFSNRVLKKNGSKSTTFKSVLDETSQFEVEYINEDDADN